MERKAVKDFAFSDGTIIPAGTFLAVAEFALHHDADNYDRPDVFDGFRFAKGDSESTKHLMVTTSNDYISFGHGRQAWYACATLECATD